MKRNVLVRVHQSNGQPAGNARVALEVHQFLASGFVPTKNTSSNGEVRFELDTDAQADITIYVDGQPRVGRGGIKSDYTIKL